MTAPNSFGTAVYIVVAMSAAGVAHVLWLRSGLARTRDAAIDLGARFRGKRIFGDNKKFRGLMMMPPAAALAFAGVEALRPHLPSWLAAGIWPLPRTELALLGFLAGLAFMLAELPNSFVKRQLQIPPGQEAKGGLRAVFFVVDRLDSALGTLLVISLYVHLTALTWFWVLLLGTGAHAALSIGLYWLGVKSRPL